MKKEKSETTEEQILEAAKDIFYEKGMNGARMQEIADKAGINKAMLHYYFRNKQLLFEAVFQNAFLLLAPKINTILNDDSTIEEKIRNFTYNYISFISVHPYLPNFVIQELNRNPGFIETMQKNESFPNVEKFNKQVEKEVEAGILKPIDGKQLFVHIISLNIFPFIATPLINGFLKLNDVEYKKMMEQRKTEVSEFIIRSIKN